MLTMLVKISWSLGNLKIKINIHYHKKKCLHLTIYVRGLNSSWPSSHPAQLCNNGVILTTGIEM
jgi:hypothetical protein